MMYHRYLITLTIVFLAGFALWDQQNVQAAVLDSIIRESAGTVGTGISTGIENKISAEKKCEAQRLVQGINFGIAAVRKIEAIDVTATIKNSAVTFATTLIRCSVGKLVSRFTGGVVSNPECVDVAKGEVHSTLVAQEAQAIQRITDDNCYQAQVLQLGVDAVEQVVAENGRDGGALFVQDWRDLAENSQYRGAQIAKSQMANTNYCPWNRAELQSVFGFGAAGSPTVRDYADGQTSYTQSAECTLPSGFDPSTPENQTLAAYAVLSLPQNSLAGSYLLAKENIERQKAAELAADEHEFRSGFGSPRAIDPATGKSCVAWNADQTVCLNFGPILQPGEGVRSVVDAKNKAVFDEYREAGHDPTAHVITNLLDATQTAIAFDIDVPYSLRKNITKAAALPEPGTSNPNDPTELACTGGNPSCVCVSNSTEFEDLRQLVGVATQAAVAAHPEFLTPDRSQVLPGANGDFLNAVCSIESLRSLNCHAIQEDEIVLDFGDSGTVSLDLITGAENGVRIPGQTVALCQAGTR
jgi:hypothetical protein